MKIAILGFGKEGRSAFEYWNKPENQITICDQNEAQLIPDHIHTQLGPKYLENLSEYDLLVRSPSLHPKDIVAANGPEILAKVTSITNEFFKVSPTKKIIGVTGTKGKGTTSTLITKLLEASGHKVHLGGNVGIAATELLKNFIQEDDWVVLELSSFQLIDLKYSPHIAVCLMLSPEHLNWHNDMDEYITAKGNLFLNQTESDITIYFSGSEDAKRLASTSPGFKIPYYEEPGAHVEFDEIKISGQSICKTSEIQLIGQHNWQNVCAALTVSWRIDQNTDVARQVITQFKGLEHRLELVREQDGIKYYNDSFASVPAATIAAIDSIKGSKIMIIGGFDRNLGLSQLADSIKFHENDIKKVLLIGESAQRTSQSLRTSEFNNFEIITSKNMSEIVSTAKNLASENDSIVLSPGFPSFDMFKNFEERGIQFQTAVNRL